MSFRDRREAGLLLADALAPIEGIAQAIVLALPRGGVEVAFEAARALRIGLDLIIVRKLGVPGHQELAMGAVASGGIRILNMDIIEGLGIPPGAIEEAAAREAEEIVRQERLYRGDRPRPRLAGRPVILVDDGIATGSTMKAAIVAARHDDPSRVIAAAPVASTSVRDDLGGLADDIVVLATPDPFLAVGLWYMDFSPTSDEQVLALLDAAWRGR